MQGGTSGSGGGNDNDNGNAAGAGPARAGKEDRGTATIGNDLDGHNHDGVKQPPAVPSRYAHLRMEPHWHLAGRKRKQKHRRTAESLGFVELTTMVVVRWRAIDGIDPLGKRYCQDLADAELAADKEG